MSNIYSYICFLMYYCITVNYIMCCINSCFFDKNLLTIYVTVLLHQKQTDVIYGKYSRMCQKIRGECHECHSNIILYAAMIKTRSKTIIILHIIIILKTNTCCSWFVETPTFQYTILILVVF